MAEHLRRQREKLTVSFEWFGPETDGLQPLRLATSEPPAKTEPGTLTGRMSVFAARNLVDDLLEQLRDHLLKLIAAGVKVVLE